MDEKYAPICWFGTQFTHSFDIKDGDTVYAPDYFGGWEKFGQPRIEVNLIKIIFPDSELREVGRQLEAIRYSNVEDGFLTVYDIQNILVKYDGTVELYFFMYLTNNNWKPGLTKLAEHFAVTFIDMLAAKMNAIRLSLTNIMIDFAKEIASKEIFMTEDMRVIQSLHTGQQ